MRFNLTTKYIITDLVGLFVMLVYFDVTVLLLLPLFMVMLFYGKLVAIPLALILWFGFYLMDPTSLMLVVITISLGGLLYLWDLEISGGVKRVDRYREKMYSLEQEHELMLKMQDEISRVSVLSERDRIAQKLHDDLGHELTGAVLAMRALESKNSEVISTPLFRSLKVRLEGSVKQLKDTVHNTTTEEPYGVDAFKAIIDDFTYCKLNFEQRGLLMKLKATHWHILLTVIKEAFTNIQKHSEATFVDVELLVDENIVRLIVKNNGVREHKRKDGMGLLYMRRRIEAFGGNMSIQRAENFSLVCVLPLKKGE